MSGRPRAALAAASAVLLGLSIACAESGPPPAPPSPPGPSEASEAPPRASRPGRFEGPSYSFEYPSQWRTVAEPTVPGVDVQIRGGKGRPAADPTLIAASDRGFKGSLEEGVNLFELETSALPNRKVLARRPIRVEGAQEALLIDQRYTQYVRDGRAVSPDEARDGDESVTLRQWTILALGRGGVTLNVAMAAPADEFRANQTEFERVADSLALRA